MNRSILVAALAIPVLMHAQAPAKYRYVTTATTYLDKATFDHSIETIKGAGIDVTGAAATNGAVSQTTTSLVSLSTRDSAGGTVYRIKVDSSLVDEGAYRKADLAARAILAPGTRLPPPPTIQPSRTILVFVKNGQPQSLFTNGRPAPNAIDPKHAWASLHLQLAGLVYLIPSAEMPAAIAAVYQDTSYASHTAAGFTGMMMESNASVAGNVTLPGAITFDSTITVWHRASADTVHSAISRTSVRQSDNGTATRALSSGVYELVFDGKALRGVKGTTTIMTTTLATANGNTPAPRKSEQTYSLLKIP